MIWGEKDLDSTRLANLDSLDQSSYMLGFNEPNFGSQVNDDGIPYNQPQRRGDVCSVCISPPPPLPGGGVRASCVTIAEEASSLRQLDTRRP